MISISHLLHRSPIHPAFHRWQDVRKLKDEMEGQITTRLWCDASRAVQLHASRMHAGGLFGAIREAGQRGTYLASLTHDKSERSVAKTTTHETMWYLRTLATSWASSPPRTEPIFWKTSFVDAEIVGLGMFWMAKRPNPA